MDWMVKLSEIFEQLEHGYGRIHIAKATSILNLKFNRNMTLHFLLRISITAVKGQGFVQVYLEKLQI